MIVLESHRVLRRLAQATAWVVLGLGVTACSSNKPLEPMPLVEMDQPEVRVQKQWRVNTGKGQDGRYSRLSPLIVDDTIITTDIDGKVRAFDRATGDLVWKTRLTGAKKRGWLGLGSSSRSIDVAGGMGQAGDLLLLGTYDAYVIALNIETGDELWRTQVTSEVLSAPQGNRDVVVAQSSDGRVAGLSAETGEILWTYDSALPVLTLRGSSEPVVRGNLAFVGLANGKLVALDMEKGTPVWEQRIAIPKGRTDLERVVDIDGSPLLLGELLFAGTYQGRMMALSASNGRPLWAVDASTANNLASDGDALYFSEASDVVRSINLGDGSERWRNEQMLRRTLNAPIVLDYDYVLVADEKGYVHVLDTDDGRYLGRQRVDSDGVRSPMLVQDEVFYVLDNSGALTAYAIESLEVDDEDDWDDEDDTDEASDEDESDDDER